jgi:hypothetical protein
MKQYWREKCALIEPVLRTMRLLVTPVPMAMTGNARESIRKGLCEEISDIQGSLLLPESRYRHR